MQPTINTAAQVRVSASALEQAFDAVSEVLGGKRYRYHDEISLHRALAAALRADAMTFRREVPLLGGRIDFVVDLPPPTDTTGTVNAADSASYSDSEMLRLGIEVKIKGSSRALHRQIQGYAEDPRLHGLIVATTRPVHRTEFTARSVPAIDGTRVLPVRVVELAGVGL